MDPSVGILSKVEDVDSWSHHQTLREGQRGDLPGSHRRSSSTTTQQCACAHRGGFWEWSEEHHGVEARQWNHVLGCQGLQSRTPGEWLRGVVDQVPQEAMPSTHQGEFCLIYSHYVHLLIYNIIIWSEGASHNYWEGNSLIWRLVRSPPSTTCRLIGCIS